MPYITDDLRQQYEPMLGQIKQRFISGSAGELAFVLYRVVLAYWDTHQSYQGANAILGALSGTAAEFYRRKVAPYEDVKIDVNGDVT